MERDRTIRQKVLFQPGEPDELDGRTSKDLSPAEDRKVLDSVCLWAILAKDQTKDDWRVLGSGRSEWLNHRFVGAGVFQWLDVAPENRFSHERHAAPTAGPEPFAKVRGRQIAYPASDSSGEKTSRRLI